MKRLALQDVSVRFGSLQALERVSVALDSGEAVMLVGPNGAGKSTLLRVLLGLLDADAGELRVDGHVRAVDRRFKARLGYLPESVAFAESLSGRQVMAFFARARGVARGEVDAILARVGLAHAAKRSIRGYSRGMRQRLGLGVAILGAPELLVLDEPTGGLDQEGLSVLWEVLHEWRTARRLVLMTTHDLTLLERRVDRVCLLCEGRVVADETPDALRTLAGLPVRVSYDLAGHHADFAAAVVNAGLTPLPAAGGLSVEVPPSRLLAALDARVGFNGAVRGVRVEEPGFDAVYEHLVAQALSGRSSHEAPLEVN